jgi:hypothetical protein
MTRLPRPLPLLLAPLLLTIGCSLVSPEAKVRDRLVQAGLDPATARCMARKLVKHLDSNQLAELGRAMKTTPDHPGPMRLDEIARRLDAVQDPKIVAVTTRAGLSCAIMG